MKFNVNNTVGDDGQVEEEEGKQNEPTIVNNQKQFKILLIFALLINNYEFS